MISYIKEDILEVIPYLSVGVTIGIVVAFFCVLLQALCRKTIHGMWILGFFLFVTYATVMIEVALLSREPGSRDSIDLVLFSTWGETFQAKAYVIENVIMFLPYGILLPLIWRPMRNFGPFLILTLGSSVALEGIQLITKRGYCQIDDVLMNVLGGILGFIIAWVLLGICNFGVKKNLLKKFIKGG